MSIRARASVLVAACLVFMPPALRSATVTIINGDAAGVGFNDTTAVAAVGGNNGTTLGQQRLNAFQAAANKWGATLASNVNIRVTAVWTALTCTTYSAVLGSAGATEVFYNFAGAPVGGHLYAKALANKIAGTDLDPATVDITANFNVNLGKAGCLAGYYFYLGLDNNHGSSIDLIGVVTHELGHGLGFQTFTNGQSGVQFVGLPSIWDDFLLDNSTNKTWSQMTNAERASSAVNTGHLVWNGGNVTAAIPQVLQVQGSSYTGADSAGRALMYSPNPYQGGSSVSHWDTSMSRNQIMEPAINSDLTHEVTPPQDLTFSLLKDIGWTAGTATTPDLTITKTHTGNFAQGQTGATYTIAVRNGGTGATSGTVTVADTLPAGLTAISMAGSGWTCTQPAGPCTRSDALAASGTYPAITVTVNVSASAPASVTNTATVSGGGETNNGNDTASDSTTVSQGLPSPVSVTPASGTGSSQTFSFVSSSAKGYAALSTILVIVNSSVSAASGCYFLYYPGNRLFYLANDSGTAWVGSATIGQTGTLQNSRCVINAASSSVSGSGNNLTLSVALSFQAAFAGTKNIYVDAYDGADSGWQQKGTWTIGAVLPGPVSVTPASGTGSSQTFAFVSSSPKGYAALSTILVIVNSTLTSVSGCYFLYYPGNGLFYLANDGSSAWVGSAAVGQTGTLQNSYCSLNAAGSSVSGSGNNLTLNVALSFQAGFAGAKNIYMDAYDGSDSGWQQKGAWTVPSSTGPPAPVSVTPGSGSGSSQTFSFVSSSAKGYGALSTILVTINNTLSQSSGCYFLYYPGNRIFYLANDTATGWAGSATVGQNGTIQNSFCTLNAAASSVSGSGNNLTLNVALTFQAAFAGSRNIYMDAFDGTESGWQQKGSWTVPGTIASPAPVAVTPNSGSGSSQTFSFVSSSPKGYDALSTVLVIVNSALAGPSGCYFLYYPGSRVFYLANDSASAWVGSATLGQTGTIQNSFCTLNAVASSVSGSGNNLTLNVALTFKPAFTGSRNIYMDAYDGTESGWQQKGSWTVP